MELFVGGSTVEELEVDGRVASVEAGRVVMGVEVVELFVGGLAVDELKSVRVHFAYGSDGRSFFVEYS